MQTIYLAHGGKSIKFQVPFLKIDTSSILIVSRQNFGYEDVIALEKVMGSFSTHKYKNLHQGVSPSEFSSFLKISFYKLGATGLKSGTTLEIENSLFFNEKIFSKNLHYLSRQLYCFQQVHHL